MIPRSIIGIGAMVAAMGLLADPIPNILIHRERGERKPAQRAGEAEILFESRQQRRAREREKPIARPTPRGRRRK